MNPELNIPFDEPDGSVIAYDLGPGAHHAAIEDGRFIPGKFGNCVFFPLEGKAEIIPQIFDFAQDFTFMIWVKADAPATQSYVLIKYPGVNNFQHILLHNPLQYWHHFCMTQEGDIVKIYINGRLKETITRQTVMTGWALLTNAPHNTGGYCSLDGGRSYPYAAPPTEIIDIIENTLEPVNIYYDSVNFSDLGVIVEKIDGPLDMPAKKDPLKVNWKDYHGEVIDLVKPVLDIRYIELKCWIKAHTQDELTSKVETLKSYLQQPGTQRLMLETGTKPLVYEVYHPGDLKVENKWRNAGPYFARFTLKFQEPEPVKRVLKVTGSSCSITLTSSKILSVYWGDGNRTMNVRGTAVTLNHTYSGAGPFYVIIAGNIEEVTAFSTDAAIVWNKI